MLDLSTSTTVISPPGIDEIEMFRAHYDSGGQGWRTGRVDEMTALEAPVIQQGFVSVAQTCWVLRVEREERGDIGCDY